VPLSSYHRNIGLLSFKRHLLSVDASVCLSANVMLNISEKN